MAFAGFSHTVNIAEHIKTLQHIWLSLLGGLSLLQVVAQFLKIMTALYLY